MSKACSVRSLFHTLGKDTECKGLRRGCGFLFRGPVGQYARNVYDFRYPTPICLKFRLDLVYDVRHADILTRPHM